MASRSLSHPAARADGCSGIGSAAVVDVDRAPLGSGGADGGRGGFSDMGSAVAAEGRATLGAASPGEGRPRAKCLGPGTQVYYDFMEVLRAWGVPSSGRDGVAECCVRLRSYAERHGSAPGRAGNPGKGASSGDSTNRLGTVGNLPADALTHF